MFFPDTMRPVFRGWLKGTDVIGRDTTIMILTLVLLSRHYLFGMGEKTVRRETAPPPSGQTPHDLLDGATRGGPINGGFLKILATIGPCL